jgi:thioredoxin 1
MAIPFTDDNFESEILEFDGVVMVDFWAPWCGPCRALAPTIDELVEEFEDNEMVKIGKYNTDEDNTYAMKYNIMSIPCVKFWKDGDYVGEIVGLNDIDTYAEKIETLLK